MPELSTGQEIHRDSVSEARSGQGRGGSGPWPFLPARGAVHGWLRSFLPPHPFMSPWQTPHVVLCTAEVPQGVRASWGGWAAGRRMLGRPGGATCRSLSGAPGAKARPRLLKGSVQSGGVLAPENLPESRRWRRVSIPWWSVGAGRRSAPEARAAGGRAASTPGRGPGRDWALLSGLDFSASTRILPRLSPG